MSEKKVVIIGDPSQEALGALLQLKPLRHPERYVRAKILRSE